MKMQKIPEDFKNSVALGYSVYEDKGLDRGL